MSVDVEVQKQQKLEGVNELLAALPSCSKGWVYRLLKSGVLPSYQLGTRRLVDVEECLAVIRERGKVGAGQGKAHA